MKRELPILADGSTYDPAKLGARCSICPCKGERIVPPEKSNLPPKLVFVGEAPGRKEVFVGAPFRGMTGQFLRSLCREVDIDFREAALNNASLCRSNIDRENEEAAVCCAPRLLRELAELPADIPIVALGKAAALSVLGSRSIMHARGFVWTAREIDPTSAIREAKKARERGAPKAKTLALKAEILIQRAKLAGRTVFPTVHPAFVLRSDTWLPVLKIDLDRVSRWLSGKLQPKDLLDAQPFTLVTPTPKGVAEELKQVCGRRAKVVPLTVKSLRAELRKLKPVVSADIETLPSTPGGKDGANPMRNKIVCIGISDGEHTVCIWPWRPAYAKHVNWLFKRSGTIGMHNGYNFDQIALQRHGVPFADIDDKLEDTLIAHHAFASHLPQRLAHVASCFTDQGPWKITFKRGGGEDKGLPPEKLPPGELVRYNCLPGNARVMLADGTTEAINRIVERRESPLVLAYNPKEGVVARRVVGWFRSRVEGQKWWAVVTAAATRKRGVVSTPDHKLRLRRGWVEAAQVRVGDELALPERRISPEQRDALLGSLLGDSSLSTSPAWRKAKQWPVAAVSGGHKASVGLSEAKARALPELLKLGKHEEPGGSYPNANPVRRYRTDMRHDLTEFRALYDTKGVKRLRVETLEQLGPIGFAWWFADDGCRSDQSVRLATNGFPLADIRKARDWFTSRFGPTSIVNGRVISLSREASIKFCEYVAPHLFPCVRYKLPRHRAWPRYESRVFKSNGQPTFALVTASKTFVPPNTPFWRKHSGSDRRYCLTVENDHNFFTQYGLVANCADAVIQARVWLAMQNDLATERDVYEVDKDNARLTRGMGIRGIGVDLERRKLLREGIIEKEARLLEEMRVILKKPAFHPMQLNEVRKALFTTLRAPMSAAEPTETGLPSTSSKTLEKLKGNSTRAGKFADKLLQWRGAVKIRGTYLDSQVLDSASRKTPTVSRTHFNWRSYGTASGRYSCRLQSCPRVENLKEIQLGDDVLLPDGGSGMVLSRPDAGSVRVRLYGAPAESFVDLPVKGLKPVVRETRTRELYIAKPGHKLVYFDLSQAELRLAAYLSNDKNYIRMCESGDVHTAIAQILFPDDAELIRTDPKGAGKPFRDVEKNSIFGFQYYADPTTIFAFVQAKGFSMVRMSDVLKMRDLVRAECADYFYWVDGNKRFVDKNGYYRCPISGRISWLGWHTGYPDIANRPIQKGIAALMNVRLPRIARALPKGAGVVAQIHDAAICEVPDRHVDRVKAMVADTWKEPVIIPANGYGSSLRVEDGARHFVMPIDCKVADRWSAFG